MSHYFAKVNYLYNDYVVFHFQYCLVIIWFCNVCDDFYALCILGVTFKAHKLILAACSKHFQDLFETAPFCPSVLVILDGTSSSNMSALLEFMYKGEVHVSQDSLPSFLKAAECLQVEA
jgi:hypothetical protein